MNSKPTDTPRHHLSVNVRRAGRSRAILHILLLLSFALLVLSAAGCARKPWRDAVGAESRGEILQLLDELKRGEETRSACIDSDVDIFFTSRVKNRAINGYVQLGQPSSLKFVTSNPLGQPLVAFVSDGHSVQFINTFEKYYTDGRLTAFAGVFDIPPVAHKSDWGKWLTGRLPAAPQVNDIRWDETLNGVWVGLVAPNGENDNPITEHLLLDPKRRLLLGRAFTDKSGSIAARISYSDWLPAEPGNPSLQPGKITITGLDYGGRLELRFSALQPMDSCSSRDFTLPRPLGYRYAPLPAENI